MNDDLYYLAGALALFVVIAFSRRIVRGAMEYLVPAVRDAETRGTPFSEERYAQNHADGLDYDLQQALRRATRLAHQNRTAEAVAVLRAARGHVADGRARAVIDDEIRRLGGEAEPTVPATATAPSPPRRDDPYADRMD
jgi:hypothetical protein